jgi:hypothetical protein
MFDWSTVVVGQLASRISASFTGTPERGACFPTLVIARGARRRAAIHLKNPQFTFYPESIVPLGSVPWLDRSPKSCRRVFDH